jgi:hypothetical protein
MVKINLRKSLKLKKKNAKKIWKILKVIKALITQIEDLK